MGSLVSYGGGLLLSDQRGGAGAEVAEQELSEVVREEEVTMGGLWN